MTDAGAGAGDGVGDGPGDGAGAGVGVGVGADAEGSGCADEVPGAGASLPPPQAASITETDSAKASTRARSLAGRSTDAAEGIRVDRSAEKANGEGVGSTCFMGGDGCGLVLNQWDGQERGVSKDTACALEGSSSPGPRSREQTKEDHLFFVVPSNQMRHLQASGLPVCQDHEGSGHQPTRHRATRISRRWDWASRQKYAVPDARHGLVII